MRYRVYILHSESLNKYYIGYTSLEVEKRLKYHLAHHKGFTSKASDWEIIWINTFENKTEAIKMEKRIKKRGAKCNKFDLEKGQLDKPFFLAGIPFISLTFLILLLIF